MRTWPKAVPSALRTALSLRGAVSIAALAFVQACGGRNEPDLLAPQRRGIDLIGPRLPAPQPSELVARYGPPKYSQYLEELIARDFFRDERNGFFLDVGAGDALVNSTTAFLEKGLGWTGIAIDAEPKHLESYVKVRPGTRFFAFFVGNKDGEVVDFYVNDREWRISSGVKGFAESHGKSHVVKVPEITLNTLLERQGVRRIDFLSMDIEQAEPMALAGFDIRRYRPRLVCIEMQKETRGAISAYLAGNGWVEIEKYRQWDSVNGWFMPGPAVPAPAAEPPPRAAAK